MREAGAFFQKFKDDLVAGLNTVAIGKIEAFDVTKSKADVTILPDGDLIKAVPVAMPQTKNFVVSLPYSKGDIVVVVFAMRDIDGVMFGGDPEPSGRMLAVDDAIVVGGINLFTGSIAGASATDLVVGKKGGPNKISMAADGKTTITGGGGATISMAADGSISIVGPNGVTITGKNSSGSW